MSTKCHDCAVKLGQLHEQGCDVERCALCGGQAISCDCVYENDSDWDGESEATEEMWAAHDAKVAKAGGRIPWEGDE
jgi:hypothetical protein